MLTVLIVGNTNTYIKHGKIITPRGYNIKWFG
jgi:precorrin-3B methylase